MPLIIAIFENASPNYARGDDEYSSSLAPSSVQYKLFYILQNGGHAAAAHWRKPWLRDWSLAIAWHYKPRLFHGVARNFTSLSRPVYRAEAFDIIITISSPSLSTSYQFNISGSQFALGAGRKRMSSSARLIKYLFQLHGLNISLALAGEMIWHFAFEVVSAVACFAQLCKYWPSLRWCGVIEACISHKLRWAGARLSMRGISLPRRY